MCTKQLEFDMPMTQFKDYTVYINCKIKGTVDTEDEAWEIIGKAPFGSIYMVRDKHGRIRSEFVPY